MDMHRGWQFGVLASPLDHAAYTHAAKGLTALIDKDIGRSGLLLAVEPLKPGSIGLTRTKRSRSDSTLQP
jgi:hypothetical protein